MGAIEGGASVRMEDLAGELLFSPSYWMRKVGLIASDPSFWIGYRIALSSFVPSMPLHSQVDEWPWKW